MPVISRATVSGTSLKYHVDLIMCIDATGSMNPVISEVKNNAKTFYQKFVEKMEVEGKKVQQLRVKVIVFRDYAVDTNSMVESPFYLLGDDQGNQTDEFVAFVDKIEAIGGSFFVKEALGKMEEK